MIQIQPQGFCQFVYNFSIHILRYITSSPSQVGFFPPKNNCISSLSGPNLQTLKCTTTPENRSMQTVQHSVHRSNRSAQTVQRSVHRLNRSVQTVYHSNSSMQTVHRSAQSVLIVQRVKIPPFGTPSVSHYKSKFLLIDRSRNIFLSILQDYQNAVVNYI